MSLIQTPWTSQPQQAVGIDWGNPITMGLVDWRSPTCGLSMVSTNGTIKTTRNGVAFSGNGAGVSGWYGVVNSGAINAANPATILALVIGASGNTDARAYSIAASTGYIFQIGSGATTSSKLRLFYRSPGRDLFGGDTSSIVFENGVPHIAAIRYTPGLLESFVDGKADITLADTASGTTSGTLWASTNTLWRGSAATQNNTSVVLGLFWSRALSDAEIKSISQNPWQIFKPLPRRIFVPVAAGGDPTLYPSLYTNENSFYAPAVSVGDVTLTPSLFSNSNTFHSATVTLGGSTQTLTPSLYSNTNTFHAPSVSPGVVTLTPALFSNTNSFFGAVVTLDSDKILYPSLVSNSNSFYGPTVSVGAVSLLPSLFVNSNTFYNHVVGGALTDSEKIDLILDILSNRQTLDATTGLYTLYADDGVTVLKTARAWEDSEGTQPYRGRGLKRLDALQ